MTPFYQIPNFYTLFYDPNVTDPASVTGLPFPLYLREGRTSFLSDCIPARKNYMFLGWNSKPDGSGITYHPGSQTPVFTKDHTLYAQWAPLGLNPKPFAIK